jgi:protein-disulfide isomerase
MSRLTVPVSKRDHIWGSMNAPVVLVEYADFECPFCGEAHIVLKELKRMMADDLTLVFRHFPLSTIHPHALQAAEAAEAAGAQERFWEMHDMLFEHQDALEETDLLNYAIALGLDLPRFARDLTEERYAGRVREDFVSGVRSGVNGTPAIFINGVRHDGSYEPASLLPAIEYAMRVSRPSPGYSSPPNV